MSTVLDKSTLDLRQRKFLAIFVVVYGAFLLLHKIAYNLFYDWLYTYDPAIALVIAEKLLALLIGIAFFLFAKRMKIGKSAWCAIAISIIVTVGIWSVDTFFIGAVVLLFVGVLLSDRILKFLAGVLIALQTAYYVVDYFSDFALVKSFVDVSVFLYIKEILTGTILILAGVLLLLTKADCAKVTEPRFLPMTQNGMKSAGITIIYSAVYLLCAVGLYVMLSKFVFSNPFVDADLVSTYIFLKFLCIVLIPAGLIPLVFVLSRKYWPEDKKWLGFYNFLICLLYLFTFGFISENFDYGYFGYFKLAPFLLVCVACALVLILKEKRPKLSLVVLAIALFTRLTLMFVATITALITGRYVFISWTYNMFSQLTFNKLFVAISALGISLVLGIVLLVRSKMKFE